MLVHFVYKVVFVYQVRTLNTDYRSFGLENEALMKRFFIFIISVYFNINV